MFILGRSRRNSTQLRVQSEASIHSDVIQEDFVESFRNLTLKSVFAVKWAAHFCPSADYFLKTDDDMFVNLPQMHHYLKTLRGKKLAAGTCGSGGKVIRNERSKYFVPYAQYRPEKWPTYCSGTGYILSGDILRQVYTASLSTPYLYMEDVFVTGLVLRKIDGVKLFPKYKFLVNMKQLEGGGGLGGGKEEEDCDDVEKAIMVHGVIEEKQWKMWRMLRACEKISRR